MRSTALAAVFLVLAACKGTTVKLQDHTIVEGHEKPPAVRALRYAGGLPLRAWDPNGEEAWCEATALVHARLFTEDGHGRTAGDLASDLAWSEDGRRATITLQGGAVFHDGAPVTAEDVVATMEAVRGREGSEVRAHLAPVTGVSVLGPGAVAVDLAFPFPELPEVLTEMAVLPARLARAGPAAVEAEPIGAGPWAFAGRDGTALVFRAHRRHHAGAPAIDFVRLVIVEDDRERARILAGGAFDLGCVKAEMLPLFSDRALFRIHRYEGGVIRAMPLDVKAPGLDDPRVRRALSALVDRERLVALALGSHGRAAWQILAPENPGFDRGLDGPALAREAALALLDDAGWRAGPDGVRSKDGVILRMRIVGWQGEAFRRKAAALVAEDWKAAGVLTEVLPVDHEGYNRLARDLHGHAETYVGGWGALSAPVSVLARKFTAAGGQNRTGFTDPEVERLLGLAAAEPRPGVRMDLVRAAARRLDALVPWIPLVHAETLFVASPALQGLDFPVVGSWYEFPRLLGKVSWREVRGGS